MWLLIVIACAREVDIIAVPPDVAIDTGRPDPGMGLSPGDYEGPECGRAVTHGDAVTLCPFGVPSPARDATGVFTAWEGGQGTFVQDDGTVWHPWAVGDVPSGWPDLAALGRVRVRGGACDADVGPTGTTAITDPDDPAKVWLFGGYAPGAAGDVTVDPPDPTAACMVPSPDGGCYDGMFDAPLTVHVGQDDAIAWTSDTVTVGGYDLHVLGAEVTVGGNRCTPAPTRTSEVAWWLAPTP